LFVVVHSSPGKPADIGGYYKPDTAKVDAVMRPSALFNKLLDQ
jgi:isocitrate dehydrogenase